MAPTESRVARPEQRWGCHRDTPSFTVTAKSYQQVTYIMGWKLELPNGTHKDLHSRRYVGLLCRRVVLDAAATRPARYYQMTT